MTWRNPKHRQQWRNTLETYVHPIIGHTLVRDVDTPAVLKIIDPIWATKNETASRIIGRIATVLDWAKAHGFRTGDNPAMWKGHLDKTLAARKRVAKVEHFPSVHHTDLPALMRALAKQTAISARALEILILTASRPATVRLARWKEIDFDTATWNRPGEHMKSGAPHRVPLSPQAVTVFRHMAEHKTGELIFPGSRLDHPMSDATMNALMERMGINKADAVPHGFRSTFRDFSRRKPPIRVRSRKNRWRPSLRTSRKPLISDPIF